MRVLSLPAPKEKKVQENKLQFLISASSLLVSRTSSQRSPAEPEQGLPSLVSVWREAGMWAQAAPLTSQQQGDKVGFGAGRVQGIPKPLRGSVGPPVAAPSESPQERAVQGTASPPQSRGKEQPPHPCSHTRTVLRSILLGHRATPCASSRGVPGLYNPHQRLSLKISGATRWLGHKCPPGPAPRQGTDHGWTAGWHKDGV